MSKIAIVGVEGSGKTVLMTVLGERFQTPDPYGLFLSPETRETSDFHRVNLGKLKNGEWPIETPHDSVRSLRWTLQRKDGNDDNEVLADLDFLDFAGEIYREAFDGGTDGADRKWAEECETLREHIRAADVLVVLVNLRNVVLRMTDERTNQVVWLSKGIVDYAKRDLKIPNVALAFTQVDAYRDVIDGAGGDLKAVLKKYLPDVSNVYSKLPLFALSAVDRTVLGADGLPRPAPRFGSQGLDDLVHWILGCTEAGKAYADEIAATKARPHELWRGIVAGMEALGADAAQPAGPSAAERCAKIAGLQAAAAELADNALRHTVKGFSDEVLSAHREALGVWAKRAERARAQWALVVRKRRAKARCAAAAAIFGALVVVSVVAVRNHNENVDRLVAEQGFACNSSFGIKHAVWKAGVVCPRNFNLVSDVAPMTWKSTRPFYRWKRGTQELEWDAGCVHPTCPDLKAAEEPEKWVCTKRGYKWDGRDGIIPDDGKVKATVKGVEWTVVVENGQASVAGSGLGEGSVGVMEIPGTVAGYPVTSIGKEAFARCKGLVAVTIPSSVTNIGSSAFCGCTGLTSVTIREGVVSIGACAFEGCVGLASITIPSSVTDINMCAFKNCAGLESVTIPSNVTCIEMLAFYDCTGLKSVTIPPSVTSIGDESFAGCSSLKSITIPSSVTRIYSEAFFGCNGLRSVAIPSSVTNIGRAAFANCEGLASVKIPTSVTCIPENAFYGCTNLVSVTIPSSVTSIGKKAFKSCEVLTAVTIPSSVVCIERSAFEFCPVKTVYSDDPERARILFRELGKRVEGIAFKKSSGKANND